MPDVILPSKPIEDFDEYFDPIEGDFFAIVDKRTKKTKKINIKYFTAAAPSTNYAWIPTFEYDLDSVVEFQGKWYKSLTVGNLGNNPATSPLSWEITNKSQSGFVYWTPGVFTGDNVIVLYKLGGRTGIFELVNPTRPFISTNFEDELGYGYWQPLIAEEIYDLTTPTTVTVGLLPSGTDIGGWTTKEILQMILTGVTPAETFTADTTIVSADNDLITVDQL